MQPISPAFAAAIATGYQMVIWANVLGPPNGGNGPVLVPNLVMSGGQIVISRTAAQRRTFNIQLTLQDSTLIPDDLLTSPMTPFGNEVQLFGGWVDPATKQPYVIPTTGLVEKIPMGVFAFTTNGMVDSGSDLTMSLSGYDRSWSVSQRSFLSAFTVAEGLAPETVIQSILTAQYPGLPPLNMAPTGFLLPPANFAQGSDPWAACQSTADTAGCELYFDPNGVPTGRPIPDPTTSPVVWTYASAGITGNPNPGTIAPWSVAGRNLTREGVSNDFTIQGTGSQNTAAGSGSTTGPITGNAADNDPMSPMNVESGFGDIPTFVSSSLATDGPTATAGAQNLLAASLGSIETYQVQAAPAPMFDVDDVLWLTAPRIKVDWPTVLDGATLAMRQDTKLTLTLRRIY